MTEEWQAHVDRWQLVIEPLQAQQREWISYAVSYGQIALRSGFILNGGAIIAVPAFAQMLGVGLWGEGVGLPFTAISVFLAGLVLAAAAAACASFAMTSYAHYTTEKIRRVAVFIQTSYQSPPKGRETSAAQTYGEETTTERAFQDKGRRWEAIAIIFGSISLVAFVVGATIGAYIIAGAPPELEGEIMSEAEIATSALAARESSITLFGFGMLAATAVLAVATTVLAVVTTLAARAARRSAEIASESVGAQRELVQAQLKVIEAQLVARFLEEYASSEMDQALQTLADFRGNVVQEIEAIRQGERRGQSGINTARRKVHYYFKKAYQLFEHGSLSEESLRLVVNVNGYDLLYEVVKPLSDAIPLPESDPTRGEWFDKLREICPPR